MNETNLRTHPYSRRELTKLHFPDTVNEESAIANLRNLMKHSPDLLAKPKETHYKTHNRTLTPR